MAAASSTVNVSEFRNPDKRGSSVGVPVGVHDVPVGVEREPVGVPCRGRNPDATTTLGVVSVGVLGARRGSSKTVGALMSTPIAPGANDGLHDGHHPQPLPDRRGVVARPCDPRRAHRGHPESPTRTALANGIPETDDGQAGHRRDDIPTAVAAPAAHASSTDDAATRADPRSAGTERRADLRDEARPRAPGSPLRRSMPMPAGSARLG